MKKIEFDEEFGTVLLEPGVGFYDLYDFIQKNNLPYWLSTPGNSWGSVIGNALDRGVGYTPYGENTKNLCGLEVVLPTGEVVRTGMGAFSNAPTWGAYPFGFGPGMGPDVRAVELRRRDQGQHVADARAREPDGMDVEFDRPEDLKAMVDTIGPLRRERVLQQSPSIGNWLRAAAVATTRGEWTDKPGALDDSVIDAIRKRFGLGWWGVSLRIYGREEVNKAAYKVLEDAMKAINPLVIKPTTWVKGQPMEYSGWTGTPITFPMQNVNWYGGRGGHIGFSADHPAERHRGAGAVPADLCPLQGIRDGLPGQLRVRRAAPGQRQRDAVQQGRPGDDGADRSVLPPAGRRRQGAGLRRVPHAPRLHGPRRPTATTGAAGR
jgi:4-cresol dehydrogenase (hydroxylating)